MNKKITIFEPNGLTNSGFILETDDFFDKDQSNNHNNMILAKRDDSKYNGINSIKYNVEGYGEFHDDNVVFHYLINYGDPSK